ncbi:uncharacterized protein LOC122502507 [Leptopilina heterotoma]|uniref:uncharacterized protein LOC122502507 n=1 Tax=Leptopilina heterotoma TaxID=63436 RepID=UPI001CA8C5EE|nr:uncharacterized protein LOC122502507 [Leptopilina heterotoma]
MPKILDIILPLNESRPLPPILVTDYKIINADEHYFLTFLHGNIGCFWLMMILVNTDTMFIICTQHACAILAAMGSKLTNLEINQNCPERDKHLKKDIDSVIIFCAKQHEELILNDDDSCSKVAEIEDDDSSDEDDTNQNTEDESDM